MSQLEHTGQMRPEYLIIREYVQGLLKAKRIGRDDLRDAFVVRYNEMVPPAEDAPAFEPVHRHDDPTVAAKKDDANITKLFRAINGPHYFHLAYKLPLIAALNDLGEGLGTALHKRLLRNEGVFYLPIDTSGKAPEEYAVWVEEFAQANMQLVKDLNDDGKLNSQKTVMELLDVVEKSMQLVRGIEQGSK